MPLGDLLGVLRDAYCRTIGIEYMHIQETEEQRWIQTQVEGAHARVRQGRKQRILERLNAAEAFERFLATKYVGTKRFGLEGAESAIPILDEVISARPTPGSTRPCWGWPTGAASTCSRTSSARATRRSSPSSRTPRPGVGAGFRRRQVPPRRRRQVRQPPGPDILLELAANPSHLETVDPIVEGMVRARQDQIDPPGSYPVLPILIHGDAAFAGQGVVFETMGMSDISGTRVGGTIHVVINNQIGFTTAPQFARSSLYCIDDRANSGAVVNPIWLLTIRWIVPPTR